MALFRRDKPRELTGRKVLLYLVASFAVVFAVNGYMVKAAISTFGGVETQSSYKAGQLFEHEVETAERQAALHWRVDGRLKRDKAGEAVLDVTVRDGQGVPVTGLAAVVRLAHPADERLDHVVPLHRIGDGAFHGEVAAKAGQWELLIDLDRGGNRVFRSRSRVKLE
jgi:nitrogen fixation protein FixH